MAVCMTAVCMMGHFFLLFFWQLKLVSTNNFSQNFQNFYASNARVRGIKWSDCFSPGELQWETLVSRFSIPPGVFFCLHVLPGTDPVPPSPPPLQRGPPGRGLVPKHLLPGRMRPELHPLRGSDPSGPRVGCPKPVARRGVGPLSKTWLRSNLIILTRRCCYPGALPGTGAMVLPWGPLASLPYLQGTRRDSVLGAIGCHIIWCRIIWCPVIWFHIIWCISFAPVYTGMETSSICTQLDGHAEVVWHDEVANGSSKRQAGQHSSERQKQPNRREDLRFQFVSSGALQSLCESEVEPL